ncbi:head GIN domain-containing protein [Fulvivirga sp.]|uniref:head GIN domain-containing protein n=1 Tax=Fulvivirga sp. TaxID=1931237 RepID=UPI0032EEE68C
MKKIGIFFTVLLITVQSYGQQRERRDVGSFDEVQVSQAIDLYLKKGTKESVEVEARGMDSDEVLTEVRGSRLKVYLEGNRYRNISVKVYVTYVELEGISASSASTVYAEGVIKGDRMTIDVSSAADVEVSVDVNDLNVSASSSGDVEVAGKSKYLEVSVSSAGGVDAYDLEAENVRVRASSGAGAKVNAKNEIDAHASSGASIRYIGNPSKSRTDSSSGGSVRKSS